MNWWLVVAGFAVHLVFFYSIFEIYFTSPLVHGMTPHRVPLKPPAKRVILFSTDGLRADKLFSLDSDGNSRAPYLRHIMEHEGAWGVSHTRVPTESRPGHVAMIAGFYEDVSAVAKGWKENPVEFDSVFNESRHTWSWGSPDILPMFSKGASGSHVYTYTYPAESEDFAGADSSNLDTWVFDKSREFLETSKKNATLSGMLQEDKIVLFLHLLGLDTNGHGHKPYSKEYLENIRLVDRGIQETVDLFDKFYNSDGQTAYVVSSDHGMTNWGSHGAGHPSETLTPLIAWGAGIRKPLPGDNVDVHPDGFEKEWKLTHVKRSDVNQADISPLMASLIGVSYPVNSVGRLPLDYLDNTPHFKAESIYVNCLEFLEQFEVKMRHKQATTLSALFTPFRLLTPAVQAAKMRDIRNLIQKLDYDEAINQSLELMDLALKGLRYYHNYDRFFLGMSIALGFIGWMTYILTVVLEKHTPIVHTRVRMDILNRSFWCSEKGIRLLFIIFGIMVAILLYVQSLPWTNYFYCLIPVVLWHKVVQRRYTFQDLWWYTLDHGFFLRAIFLVISGVCWLEIMVVSFFYRELLSIGLLLCASWPFITHLAELSKTVTLGWMLSCLGLAVFPLLPVVGGDSNYMLVYLAGVVGLGLAFAASFRFEANIFVTKRGREASSAQVKLLTSGQMAVVLAATVIVWSTSRSISSKQGLPLLNQILSWFILGSSFILPLFSSSRMLTRLVNIGLSFLPPYLLMSTAHEGLYILTLCIMLFFWLQSENKLLDTRIQRLEDLDFSGRGLHLSGRQRKLVLQDVRNAFFFVFLLLTAFFGTGNIASINSFDPASVYCFLTVFSPFTMGALMLWKILIPFLLVTCTFNAIHLCINVPTQSLFLVVLLISDFMGLHFFFLIKEEGSWLDIGTSISHFVIVMTLILFLCLLLALGKVFTQITICLGHEGKRHVQ